MRDWVINEHGVWGYWSHCGTMFGRSVEQPDGTVRFQAALPLFVPKVCVECPEFDYGEYGDYGNLLSGPYCEANIWFPTRKGTCKRGERHAARYWLRVEATNLSHDLEVAAQHMNRFGSAHTIPMWMLPIERHRAAARTTTTTDRTAQGR